LKLIDDRDPTKRRLTVLSTSGLSLFVVMLVIVAAVVTVVIVPSISAALILPFSYAQSQNAATNSAACISYDPTDKIITISCDSASLTDINNQVKDANVIHKEENNTAATTTATGDNHRGGGVWLLNAGIVVTDTGTLYINYTDTSWLKINADGDTGNGIDVHGRLKIDSVKITSWNIQTNDYAKTDVQGKIPRPYILVEKDATGTTDIINSELAYLGYFDSQGGTGLRYNGGSGSLVKGNHIHDLQTGFYSDGVGGMIIEGNLIHDNTAYGIDPHTGTHDMIIRNNVVHNNGEEGIICSLDCYNITFEGNEAYNNAKSGIMFSRNMYDSVARNNYIHNEVKGIFVSASNNNQVYNNTVSDIEEGIYLKAEAANNKIHDNTITNAKSNGILVNTGAHDNTFSSNTIINATKFGINVAPDSNNNNTFENNKLINAKVAGQQE
jgi:poly(beta-D-mannuronate) C5 epimerase